MASGTQHLPVFPPGTDAFRKSRRAIVGVCCAAALVVVLYSNWCSVGRKVLADPVHGWLIRAAQLGYLYQSWGMFGVVAPDDCWFVYQVQLKDGRRLDLLSPELGAEHDESMLAWQQFANDRWRKMHWNLLSDFGQPYRQPLAEYICRRWNETHEQEQQIVRFDLYCHRQPFATENSDGKYVRIILAEVVASTDGGNFAEAVRQLDEPF